MVVCAGDLIRNGGRQEKVDPNSSLAIQTSLNGEVPVQ